FQAEDGIRDFHVTGVQTCALPISQQGFDMGGGNAAEGTGSSRADNMFNGTLTTTVIGVLPNGNLQIAGEKQIAINRGSEHIRFRSEERRVGQEGRSRREDEQ